MFFTRPDVISVGAVLEGVAHSSAPPPFVKHDLGWVCVGGAGQGPAPHFRQTYTWLLSHVVRLHRGNCLGIREPGKTLNRNSRKKRY